MSMPETRERTQDLLLEAIDASDAHETQVTLSGGRRHTLGFADAAVAAGAEERWSSLSVRLAYHNRGLWRLGVASTTAHTPKALVEVVSWARSSALASESLPAHAELPWPDEFESDVTSDGGTPYDARTALAGPAMLADQAARVSLPSLERGYRCRGAVTVTVGTIEPDGSARPAAIANSNGVFHLYVPTSVRLCASVFASTGGYAELVARASSIDALDLGTHVDRALTLAELPLARSRPAGAYRVVLEAPAVSALIDALRPHFSWRAVTEGWSALDGRLGEPILGASIGLVAHPRHAEIRGRPFDDEGWPRPELGLVEGGRLTRFLHTRAEALVEGVSGSGYTEFDGVRAAAIPEHIVMSGGAWSLDDILQTLDDGLLVRRLTSVEVGPGLTVTGLTGPDVYTVRGGQPTTRLGALFFRADLGVLLGDEAVLGTPERAGDNLVPPVGAQGFEVMT